MKKWIKIAIIVLTVVAVVFVGFMLAGKKNDKKLKSVISEYTVKKGENKNGDFGIEGGLDESNANDPSWYTPYIYLVVNPPLSADGGSRTGWGYRISFLYS